MAAAEGSNLPAKDRVEALVAAIAGPESGRAMPGGNGDRNSLSVIIPARDAAATLPRCLAALQSNAADRTEIIVVDDGSMDATGEVATTFGVRLYRFPASLGPGPARNHGARHAAGNLLVFVDADIEVAPASLALIERWFGDDARRVALFGSYDATPRESDVVSRYRNLLHHFVHQHGPTAPSHFWAGFGAIRRDVFLNVGGFDEERYARACEDIELGYRLRSHGFDIHLHKGVQGTHLKRWTLRTMIRTDFALRASIWVRLLLERGIAPGDLSLAWRHRLSVALAGVVALMLAGSHAWPPGLAVAGLLTLVFALCNLPLLRFFAAQHGARFVLCCVPLHLLHSMAAAAGAVYGLGQALAGHVARPLPAPAGKT